MLIIYQKILELILEDEHILLNQAIILNTHTYHLLFVTPLLYLF